MKYVAIDIETTGLDPERHDILEVAAIIDDTNDPEPFLVSPDMSNRPNFRAVIIDPDGEYVTTPFCAELHAGLWVEIEQMSDILLGEWDQDVKNIGQGKGSGEPQDATAILQTEGCMYVPHLNTHYCTPDKLAFAMAEWLLNANQGEAWKPTFAGKNASTFDLPFLMGPAYQLQSMIDWDFRVLDVGSMYIEPRDEKIPSLGACLARIGREPTNLHSAMGDTIDVVYLVREKLVSIPVASTDAEA